LHGMRDCLSLLLVFFVRKRNSACWFGKVYVSAQSIRSVPLLHSDVDTIQYISYESMQQDRQDICIIGHGSWLSACVLCTKMEIIKGIERYLSFSWDYSLDLCR
jgi:hypothetical protein